MAFCAKKKLSCVLDGYYKNDCSLYNFISVLMWGKLVFRSKRSQRQPLCRSHQMIIVNMTIIIESVWLSLLLVVSLQQLPLFTFFHMENMHICLSNNGYEGCPIEMIFPATIWLPWSSCSYYHYYHPPLEQKNMSTTFPLIHQQKCSNRNFTFGLSCRPVLKWTPTISSLYSYGAVMQKINLTVHDIWSAMIGLC